MEQCDEYYSQRISGTQPCSAVELGPYSGSFGDSDCADGHGIYQQPLTNPKDSKPTAAGPAERKFVLLTSDANTGSQAGYGMSDAID